MPQESAAAAAVAPASWVGVRWPAVAGAARRPLADARWAAVVLAAFAATWLGYLALTSRTVPVDNLEQLMWARQLGWGYHKHPPLPTWLLWPLLQLGGWRAWTPGLLGAALTLAALGLGYRLQRRLLGERAALVALLATLGITFYNGRLDYYSHNAVLFVAVQAAACCTWLAFARRRLRWWAALGVVLGLGALAKYQIVLTVAGVALVWLMQRGWRDAVHRRGALLALALAAAVFAPHAAWLAAHGAPPLHYAAHVGHSAPVSGDSPFAHAWRWSVDTWLNRALPAWVLLAVLGWQATRGPRRAMPVAAPDAALDDAPRAALAQALLFGWGVLPLLAMTACGLGGVNLQNHWATAFMGFTVAAAMAAVGTRRWRQVDRAGLLRAFLVVQLVLLTISAVQAEGPQRWRKDHWRVQPWPTWAEDLGRATAPWLDGRRPLVVAPTGPGGVMAQWYPGRPAVLIDHRVDASPWVHADELSHCPRLHIEIPPGPDDEVVAHGRVGPQPWWLVRAADPQRRCPTRAR